MRSFRCPRITPFFALLAVLATLPVACCRAADSSVPAPAPLPRPLRIAIGYDDSSTSGRREGGFSLFNSTPFTTDQDGALRLAASYDIWQDGSRAWTGLIYSDDEFVPFDSYFYYSLGFAVRRPLGASGGFQPYYGAGVGLYSVWLPDTTSIGVKLFAGLQDQGAAFIEAGVTAISSGGYSPGLSVVIGVRL